MINSQEFLNLTPMQLENYLINSGFKIKSSSVAPNSNNYIIFKSKTSVCVKKRLKNISFYCISEDKDLIEYHTNKKAVANSDKVRPFCIPCYNYEEFYAVLEALKNNRDNYTLASIDEN